MLRLWRAFRCFWATLLRVFPVMFSSHPFAAYHRLSPRVFPVSDLPRLQRLAPFLCGLPPLSAPLLHSPRGGSCKRVHDLFWSSIHGIFLQCALLPSAHSLRVPGGVSPLLR